jgi:hypothetical protein
VQAPRVACLPFFIVICSVSGMALECLHFMQYPSIIDSSGFVG